MNIDYAATERLNDRHRNAYRERLLETLDRALQYQREETIECVYDDQEAEVFVRQWVNANNVDRDLDLIVMPPVDGAGRELRIELKSNHRPIARVTWETP